MRRLTASFVAGSCLVCTFIAGLATVEPVRSEPLQDSASGLTVAPPEGHAATRMSPSGKYTVRIAVKSPTDRDTGCQVGFIPDADNAEYTQAEINRLIASPQSLDLVRATFAPFYDIQETAPFAIGDIQGVMFVGELKQVPNIPPRAREMRSLLFLVDTPRGRTTISCACEKADFDFRRTEFEVVARGVQPPH